MSIRTLTDSDALDQIAQLVREWIVGRFRPENDLTTLDRLAVILRATGRETAPKPVVRRLRDYLEEHRGDVFQHRQGRAFSGEEVLAGGGDATLNAEVVEEDENGCTYSIQLPQGRGWTVKLARVQPEKETAKGKPRAGAKT